MSLFGNLLWIILGGGIFIFLGYLIGGIVLCLTIVGIPFGVQLLKLSVLGLTPFGKRVDSQGIGKGPLPMLMNVLWWVFGGLEVALVHLVFAGIMTLTVIGIPFAQQHMKLLQLSLMPFGARVRERR
jgi:uncharacterized membrane protein YccF (DUF307 family)